MAKAKANMKAKAKAKHSAKANVKAKTKAKPTAKAKAKAKMKSALTEVKEVTLAAVRTLSNALVDSKRNYVEAAEFLSGRIDGVNVRLGNHETAVTLAGVGIDRIDIRLEQTDEEAKQLKERVAFLERSVRDLHDRYYRLAAWWQWETRDMGKGAKAVDDPRPRWWGHARDAAPSSDSLGNFLPPLQELD